MAIIQTLNATSEIMLHELIEVIPTKTPNRLRKNLVRILSQYDIKPASVPSGKKDLPQKIKLFIAGKSLEGLSPGTLSDYETELKLFSRHTTKLASEITTPDIRVYLSNFKKLKTSSVSKKLSILKSMFGWLALEGIITSDPTKRIKNPRSEKRAPKSLTIAELEMIRESCETLRERAIVEVLYSTGCRLSEAQQIDRSEINYQELSVQVIGKGNKERTVYFSFKAMYHLKKYLSSRKDTEDALIVTERRPYRRLSERCIQGEIARISERSTVTKNVHPHIFRHTFATLMLNNGADITAVQELLGHSDPSTTQGYATMTRERIKRYHDQYLVQ
jgi:integrase/recombinase XerD